MPFTNQPPGYQIGSAVPGTRPVFENPYPPFNTNQFVIKGNSPAPVAGSNAFGGSLRGKGCLQTHQPKTSF